MSVSRACYSDSTGALYRVTHSLCPIRKRHSSREHSRTLSAVLALNSTKISMESEEKQVDAHFVTVNFFSELGITARLGRMFVSRLDIVANGGSGLVSPWSTRHVFIACADHIVVPKRGSSQLAAGTNSRSENDRFLNFRASFSIDIAGRDCPKEHLRTFQFRGFQTTQNQRLGS